MWWAVRPPLSTPVTRRKTVRRAAGQDVFSTVATRDAIHPDLPCATYRPRLADKGLCTRWPMAAPVQVLPDWRCPPSVARWWATKTQPREVMRVQPYSALSSASPLPRLFDDVRPIQPSTGGCSSPALCALRPSLYFGTEHGRVLRTVLVVDDHLTEDAIDKNEQVFFSALCWVPYIGWPALIIIILPS